MIATRINVRHIKKDKQGDKGLHELTEEMRPRTTSPLFNKTLIEVAWAMVEARGVRRCHQLVSLLRCRET